MAMSASGAASKKRPNILLIIADDMSYDSLGCSGCKLPGISPNIDRLASQGVLIEHGHIITPICGPSRHALHTGRYPHQSGCMGHGKMPPAWFKPRKKIPSLSTYLHANGYRTGMLTKSGAGDLDKWDMRKDHTEMKNGRDPNAFYKFSKQFFDEAKSQSKPFFLNANPQDPHRYWARTESERQPAWWKREMKNWKGKEPYKLYPNGLPWPDPKTDYDPKDIPLPAMYPDLDPIRNRLNCYYDSVNRMDEVTGAVLKALEESGLADNTLVLFLSDHGKGWSYAKWSLYPYGTRTPIIARWPGRIKPGRTDRKSVVSAIDLMPTFIEAAGLAPVDGIDGRSFLPLLSGRGKAPRFDRACSSFDFMNNLPGHSDPNQQPKNNYRPSRSITSAKYCYIWNGWADGKTQVAVSMARNDWPIHIMKQHPDNADYKRRVRFWQYRTPEEFYDIENDPACRKNLIDDPKHAETIREYRNDLHTVMKRTEDHELDNFEKQTAAG